MSLIPSPRQDQPRSEYTARYGRAAWEKHLARASMVIRAGGDEYLVMASPVEKPTKLSVPENWDKIDSLSDERVCTWAGANDWENSWSAVAFYFGDNPLVDKNTTRVWGHITPPAPEEGGVTSAASMKEHGKKVVESWIKAAHAACASDPDPYNSTHIQPQHFIVSGSTMAGLRGYGVERVAWRPVGAASASHQWEVVSDNTDPLVDSGPNAPVSKNPAPPAVPFPAKVAPQDSAPNDDKGDTPNAADDDTDTPEYVGGGTARASMTCPICGGQRVSSCRCSAHTMAALQAGHGAKCSKGHRWSRAGDGTIISYDPSPAATTAAMTLDKLNPQPLPNPEKGGLTSNPNPDNDSQTPKSSDAPESPPDDIDDSQWFLGSKGGLAYRIDPQTGLAKWPLEFKTIERDFKRPGKPASPDPVVPDHQDSERDYQQNKPYVI